MNNKDIEKRIKQLEQDSHPPVNWKELIHSNIKRIEELETQVEALQAFNFHTDIKLERIDDILVVHRNQSDTQRKNHANLIKVWDEKVIPLIEGTHGKQK